MDLGIDFWGEDKDFPTSYRACRAKTTVPTCNRDAGDFVFSRPGCQFRSEAPNTLMYVRGSSGNPLSPDSRDDVPSGGTRRFGWSSMFPGFPNWPIGGWLGREARKL